METSFKTPIHVATQEPSHIGKVTLVIGSGGVKCAAAIGVAKVLKEHGIGIERVVGCSGGAVFASLIAMQVTPEKAKTLTETIWTPSLTSKKNYLSLLQMIAPKWFGFKAAAFGLRSGTAMESCLANFFGDLKIEAMPIPLHIVATDFSNGDLVEISSGSIALAVRASSAIPFVVPAVEMNGKMLIDGYVADPLPISIAIKHNAEIIVAIGFESPTQSKVNSVGKYAAQFSSIMANNLLKARFSFQSAVHHGEVIAMIPKFKQRIGLFDTKKLPYIISEGEETARQQIGYLVNLLKAQAYSANK
jgi:NTE family protein